MSHYHEHVFFKKRTSSTPFYHHDFLFSFNPFFLFWFFFRIIGGLVPAARVPGGHDKSVGFVALVLLVPAELVVAEGLVASVNQPAKGAANLGGRARLAATRRASRFEAAHTAVLADFNTSG